MRAREFRRLGNEVLVFQKIALLRAADTVSRFRDSDHNIACACAVIGVTTELRKNRPLARVPMEPLHLTWLVSNGRSDTLDRE